jgi:hypothetical protein
MKCRSFFFHSDGTIWRTGALGRLAALEAPELGAAKRLAEVLRQTQGAFAAMGAAAWF